MIRDIERYHGAVLARLIRGGGAYAIQCKIHPRFRSAYVLDRSVAIYVKYSTSRLSPWKFGFKTEHRHEIDSLADEFFEVFVGLACGFDGIACLDADEYFRLGSSDSIRVARGPRQKYALSGGNEKNVLRVGNNEFPAKVHAAIRAAGNH